MRVAVVQVRRVHVAVHKGRVRVFMHMQASDDDTRCMCMLVVLVVHMGMAVRERLVVVLVRMTLAQMHDDTEADHNGAQDESPRHHVVTDHKRETRPHKRRE